MDASAYAKLRQKMVDKQILARGVADARVLDAMRTVPRHRFVPEQRRGEAYDDHPLGIGCGQTISQPYMVGLMTALLALRAEDRVLEIGTGSGYQTAVLACLATEVVSVERVAALADAARERLEDLAYDNVSVMVGDGTLGWPPAAPYDAILVTAGGPRVPDPLKEQLAEGGRLVCPAGSHYIQRLKKIVRRHDRFVEEDSIDCSFVPLIGEKGWDK